MHSLPMPAQATMPGLPLPVALWVCVPQLDKLSTRSRVVGRDLKLPIQQARLVFCY